LAISSTGISQCSMPALVVVLESGFTKLQALGGI